MRLLAGAKRRVLTIRVRSKQRNDHAWRGGWHRSISGVVVSARSANPNESRQASWTCYNATRWDVFDGKQHMPHSSMCFAFTACGIDFSVGNGEAWKCLLYLLFDNLPGLLILF